MILTVMHGIWIRMQNIYSKGNSEQAYTKNNEYNYLIPISYTCKIMRLSIKASYSYMVHALFFLNYSEQSVNESESSSDF